MATTDEQPGTVPEGPGPGEASGRPTRRSRRWWRRPWVVPLMLVAVIFLAFSLPPYLTFDPGQSRIPVREDLPLHYPLLVVHILFGTVVLLTACLQVWPWLRGRYPAVHRWSGRTYLFVGVLPTSAALVLVAPLSSTGFASQVGNTMLAMLWLAFSIIGYRMARQRRFADHRRWMIRSFALAFSIVANRPWVLLMTLVLVPQLETTYGGDFDTMVEDAAQAAVWLSWVVNLLIAEWWLQRGNAARRRARKAAVAGLS